MEADYSPILEGTGPDFDLYVMCPEGLDGNQFFAPEMDRTEVSASSVESHLSTSSLPDPYYATSPLSSFGSPASEGDFMRRRSYTIEQLPNSFLSPESAALSRESSAGLPLFNIERDGNPRIQWFMYNDFVVTKTEAYYQLQPGYLPTEKYPSRVNSEKAIINGEKRHPCGVLECKAKPFTRHYDLERHFATIHQRGKRQSSKAQGGNDQGDKDESEKLQMNCDYKKCTHTDSFRKDHCREHYREYHSEDLIKRGQPKNSKAKNSKKKPETTEEFLASRIKNLSLSWWRCSKCVRRVQLNLNGYTCPTCNQTCEGERITWRENARRNVPSSPNNAKLADTALAFRSTQTNTVSGCGVCENTWLPDEDDDELWVSCPQCRPGIKETMRST